MTKFKEFKIEDLFDIHPTATYKMKNAELYKQPGNTPVLSNSASNNGIGGYSALGPTEKGGIITFSDTTVGADTMFYQPDDFIGYPHVQGMYPLLADKWDEACCLYAISAIRKAAGDGWSYTVKFNRASVKQLRVILPVIESSDPSRDITPNNIDWAYMHDFISELEQEYIAEKEQARIAGLDVYLKAAGFANYKLTDEDKKVLVQDTEMKEFKVKDVFKHVSGKCKKDDFDKRKDTSTVPSKEFSIPLVNAKFGDNGIMFYGRESDWNTQEMCIDVVQNGAVATGSVYAQPQPVGVLWDAYLIKPVFQVSSVEPLLYMATCIEKITKEQFSYDKKATWGRVKLCEISLPIDSDGNINVGYVSAGRL